MGIKINTEVREFVAVYVRERNMTAAEGDELAVYIQEHLNRVLPPAPSAPQPEAVAPATEAAPDIYKKAIDLLEKHLTVDEMIAFHETLDGDPTNDFFWRLSETCARLRPDLFVTPFQLSEREAETLGKLIENPPAPTAKLVEAMERHRDKGGK